MAKRNPKIEKVLSRGVEEIIERDSLENKLQSGKKLRVKLGIDPTGPKIHLGRAIQFKKLKEFQDLGHQIVLILGTFTAKVGDASDKQAMRKPMTEKQIEENLKNYLEQIGKIINIEKAEVRKNEEWLKNMDLEKLLPLTERFTAGQMIQRRNFKERWDKGKPIGVHELLYPIMQGYDSVAIRADVEIGGTDQLFNLKAGRELQRYFGQEPQDIMTLEMLYGLDGRKMSTSWGNVITIVDEPQDMFGKVMSMKDNLMLDYFRLCTDLDLLKIEKIKKEIEEGANPRNIKARLAREITSIYRGEKEAKKAEKEFNKVFSKKENPQKMPEKEINAGEYALSSLLTELKLCSSKTEAKRLTEQGGLKINGETIKNWKEKVIIKKGDIIKAGKRKFVKIV